jgi:hypothetical protein
VAAIDCKRGVSSAVTTLNLSAALAGPSFALTHHSQGSLAVQLEAGSSRARLQIELVAQPVAVELTYSSSNWFRSSDE